MVPPGLGETPSDIPTVSPLVLTLQFALIMCWNTGSGLAPQLKCWIQAWITAGRSQANPVLALSSSMNCEFDCFRAEKASSSTRFCEAAAIFRKEGSCDITLVPTPLGEAGISQIQNIHSIFEINQPQMGNLCVQMIFVKYCWNIKMATEASTHWWGRSVVWHTWPELSELPLDGMRCHTFFN